MTPNKARNARVILAYLSVLTRCAGLLGLHCAPLVCLQLLICQDDTLCLRHAPGQFVIHVVILRQLLLSNAVRWQEWDV